MCFQIGLKKGKGLSHPSEHCSAPSYWLQPARYTKAGCRLTTAHKRPNRRSASVSDQLHVTHMPNVLYDLHSAAMSQANIPRPYTGDLSESRSMERLLLIVVNERNRSTFKP